MNREADFYEKKLFCMLGSSKKFANQVLGSRFFEGGLDQVFEHYARILDTDQHRVVGSFFSDWYVWLCSSFFYELSHHDHIMDFSFDNIALQYEGKSFLFQVINASRGKAISQEENREDAIREALRLIFFGHIKKVFDYTAEITGIDLGTQWATASSSLHYMYEAWIRDTDQPELQAKLKNDLHYMTSEAEAELFGLTRRNPLRMKFRWIPDAYEEGQLVRMKNKCCLHYILHQGKGSYCYTCPSLSEEEREKRRVEIQEKRKLEALK